MEDKRNSDPFESDDEDVEGLVEKEIIPRLVEIVAFILWPFVWVYRKLFR